MKIEYLIQEEDFLKYQLFTASKSERINRKKRNGWIGLTIGSLLFALYFYNSDKDFLTYYFVVVAMITGLFYPKYFKWRYKKHYRTYIKENYKNRFNERAQLEFTPEYIESKDKTGEGKIKTSELKEISETSDHFFVKLSTGMSLIIPKKEFSDLNQLRGQLEQLNIPIKDELNWEW